jgi:hypothetical protein
VYQFAVPNYYEPMEDEEVVENTNINVIEETEEKYQRPYEYVEAHVNVLDEVPQSYSHPKNPELNLTRYIIKTKDHEFMDLEVARLFSRICAFYEEGHIVMDCPFVPFHIKASIA